jgi:hypothetical protein
MDIDIIGDILRKLKETHPGSGFIQSLHQQYSEKGSLSRKQLEGLAHKAAKSDIPPAKLATLQAIILRKHSKHRSDLPVNTETIMPLHNVEQQHLLEEKISRILNKYPAHKRVLYFKSRNAKEGLSPAEISELEKFYKILIAS